LQSKCEPRLLNSRTSRPGSKAKSRLLEKRPRESSPGPFRLVAARAGQVSASAANCRVSATSQRTRRASARRKRVPRNCRASRRSGRSSGRTRGHSGWRLSIAPNPSWLPRPRRRPGLGRAAGWRGRGPCGSSTFLSQCAERRPGQTAGSLANLETTRSPATVSRSR
jgi:hypothetical protein